MALTGSSFGLGVIVTLLIPFLVGLWLAFKISIVTDQYYIRNELINGFKVIAVTMLLCLFVYLVFGWGAHKDEKSEVIFYTIIEIFSTLFLCYFSTVWVLKKLKRIQRKERSGNDKDDSDLEVNGKRHHKMTEEDIENYEKNKKTLRDLLRDKEGYNIFMEHLVKFSVTCLFLFCIFFVCASETF